MKYVIFPHARVGLALLLILVLCTGWTRPAVDAPVILIEQIFDCHQYEWDTRPCQTLYVQNGFAGWQKQLTIDEVNQLVESLFFEVCHPELKTQMRAGMWQGVVISPVNPFGDYLPPHFEPHAWEVRCG